MRSEPREPARQTLGALRAVRDAQRVAEAVRLDRITAMGTVACAECGKPVAVATDADHPTRDYEGRVVCGPCTRRRRHPHPLAEDLSYEVPPARMPPAVQRLDFLCRRDPDAEGQSPCESRLRAWLRRLILG